MIAFIMYTIKVTCTCAQNTCIMVFLSYAADASEGEDAFAAIKLTGLGRTEFLVSAVLHVLCVVCTYKCMYVTM